MSRLGSLLLIVALALTISLPISPPPVLSAEPVADVLAKKLSLPERDARRLGGSVEAAVKAGLDRGPMIDLIVDMVESGYSVVQAERIVSLATRSALNNLPVEPLLDKLREGLSKRVDPALVVKAVGDKALYYKLASELLQDVLMEGGDALDPMAVLVVGDLLHEGISQDTLRETLLDLSKEDFTCEELIRRVK